MKDIQELIHTNAHNAFGIGVRTERERIIKNIQSRISDLRACSKKDNCVEFAALIDSYISEWTGLEQK